MENTIQLSFPAADPFILRASDGLYYLYCTAEDGGAFSIRVSADLRSWKLCGTALGPGRSRWGTGCFWAPECYEIGGRYYLFYSADWKVNPTGALENFRIGVAVADTPAGPFEDLADRPIFDPGYPIIDANLYAENGRYFLYYSRCCYEHNIDGLEESWIYGVELLPDFSGVRGEPVLLLRPEDQAAAPKTDPALQRKTVPSIYEGYKEIPLMYDYAENSRALGLADMCKALRTGRAFRANYRQQHHVLEILTSFTKSSQSGALVPLKTHYERSAPMQNNPLHGVLDD